MRAATIVLLVAAAFVLAGCATTDEDGTQVSAFEGYEAWTKVNSQIITGDSTGTLGRNVHQGSTGFRDVFVNQTGSNALGSDGSYPVGTIFVKNSYAEDNGSAGELVDVTVMVKREAGYDAENGDWEYVFLGDDLKVRGQGAINNCIACHTAAAGTDYIFANYR